MKTVYFDRNVFADICDLRHGLTECDVEKIQRAVDSETISIPVSYTVIEETISLLRDSDEGYKRHIQTVLNIIDRKRLIKAHNHLTKEDCLSYAFKQSKTPRTESVPANFAEVLDLSVNEKGLVVLAEDIRIFYEENAVKRQNQFDILIEETKRRGFTGFGSFQEAWDALSVTIVERLVEALPRTEKRLCKKHGVQHMLHIRSVRIYAIYECWLLYSHWLRADGTPGKMKASEGADFFHAVCASAADIFVTQESKDRYGRLPYILGLVPISGFTVMSLQEFLVMLDREVDG